MRSPEAWKGRVTRRAICGVLASSGNCDNHRRPGGLHSGHLPLTVLEAGV